MRRCILFDLTSVIYRFAGSVYRLAVPRVVLHSTVLEALRKRATKKHKQGTKDYKDGEYVLHPDYATLDLLMLKIVGLNMTHNLENTYILTTNQIWTPA